MSNGDDIEERVKQKFLALPPEKQQKIHAMMSGLFQKLENEWKADPNNSGKPFSYSKMWEDYVSHQKDRPKTQEPH